MIKYCSILDVENYLLTEIDASFESQVETWIAGISRAMDTMAGRKLVADVIGSGDDYETKYYDGNGKSELLIDDCVDIQSVEIGDVVQTVTPYPKVAPHRKLIYTGGFPIDNQNVKVVGNFGLFEETPDDIRLACTILVAGVINAELNKHGKKSESIGGTYSVTYVDDKGVADFEHAKAIVEGYRKIVF